MGTDKPRLSLSQSLQIPTYLPNFSWCIILIDILGTTLLTVLQDTTLFLALVRSSGLGWGWRARYRTRCRDEGGWKE